MHLKHTLVDSMALDSICWATDILADSRDLVGTMAEDSTLEVENVGSKVEVGMEISV